MSNSTVSVVIATRNRSQLLQPLVERIFNQSTGSDIELVMVDDASTDDTPAVLSHLAAEDTRIKIRRLPRHRGPAAARNLGWRSSRGETVAFTDDDCLPASGWLDALLAGHASGCDVVQGQTLPDIEDYFARGTFSRAVKVTEFSHLYETCNISYRRTLLEQLNGFDEHFGTSLGGAPNGEDSDLGWRAAKAGSRSGFAAGAVVRHPVTASSFLDSLTSRLRSARMVYFVRRHPEARATFPHRYFFQESHPWALTVVAAWVPALVTRRRSSAVLGVIGTLPYLKFRTSVRRLPGRRRHLPAIVAGAWLIDMTDVLVLSIASVRWRRLLL